MLQPWKCTYVTRKLFICMVDEEYLTCLSSSQCTDFYYYYDICDTLSLPIGALSSRWAGVAKDSGQCI